MSDLSGISQWLGVLAAELAERMAEDEAEHSRRPRSLGRPELPTRQGWLEGDSLQKCCDLTTVVPAAGLCLHATGITLAACMLTLVQ